MQLALGLCLTEAKQAKQEKFEALQAKWRAAHKKELDLSFAANHKYGTWYIHAPRGVRERIERARAAESKAMDAVFAWLDAHSPRAWRTGTPAYWICDKLTYADAMTEGQLSVVPPPPYGYTTHEMERFARPIEQKEPTPTW